MLRQVYITKGGEVIYQSDFGKALDDEGFKQAYKLISKEAFKIASSQTKFHDYFQYRINYLSVPDKKIIFLFVTDLSDKFNNVKKELERCRKEFLALFEDMLDEPLDEDSFEFFAPTMDLIHKNLRPKISLVGFSGVGKTTITRLITAEDIPLEHVPTITGDIGTIKIGKLHFHLWDFAGQEQFSFLWNNFIKGSDAVLLITDSSLENCEKSKYFTELIRKEAPYSHAAVIGNKQDLPDAMPITDIERILELKAYSMIAVDPNNRDKMITIIADILEMSGEVSPLLKPLLSRDSKLLDAEKAVEDGDFHLALALFDELADLSLELGDDRVSQDFVEKADKIRDILGKMEQAVEPVVEKEIKALAPPPAPPIEPPVEENVIKAKITDTPPPPPVAPPVSTPLKTPPPAPIEPPVEENVIKAEKTATPPPPPVAPPITPPQADEKKSTTTATPPPPPVAPPITPSQVDEKKSLAAAIAPPSAPSEENIDVEEKPPQLEQNDQLGALLQKIQDDNKKPPVGIPLASNQGASVLGNANKLATPIENAPGTVNTPPPMPTAVPISNQSPPAAPMQPSASQVAAASDKANIITELKIKIAKVNKTLLDLEMDNITGDLSDEDYEKKSKRLEMMKGKIDQQIKEIGEI